MFNPAKLSYPQNQPLFSLDLSAELISQLPNLILIMDLDSKFIYSNSYTAALFGYSNEDTMLGINAYGMRCPASECADLFIQQDKQVISKETQLTLLDVHTYAQNDQKVLLTKKIPFYLQGKLFGIICYCNEIDPSYLKGSLSCLIDSDKKYYDKSSQCERSYILNNVLNKSDLSQRERECLFYIMRGYTSKMIGKKLNISHRTVETYLENIKNKWACSRKDQVIEYAILNGYLSYIPDSFFTGNYSMILNESIYKPHF